MLARFALSMTSFSYTSAASESLGFSGQECRVINFEVRVGLSVMLESPVRGGRHSDHLCRSRPARAADYWPVDGPAPPVVLG